jgi:hypothetical protein
VSLTRSEAVLELGKKLVAQLGTHDDLLASWMAHYIAERIEAVESASTKDRGAAQEACANAILELWRYRSSLPGHLRPLGELEPILRTLALLDVDRTDFRYSPAVLREAATADAAEDCKRWLEIAIELDYSARLLIQFALRFAAHRAATEAEPWVQLALQAGADEGAESATVRFVLEGDEESGALESDQDEDNRAAESDQGAALLGKLSRLETFAKLANLLVTDLRAKLNLNSAEDEIEGAEVGADDPEAVNG